MSTQDAAASDMSQEMSNVSLAATNADLDAKAKSKAAQEERARQKAERAAQRGQKGTSAAAAAPEPEDPLADRYGDLPMITSTVQTGRVWTDVADLSPALKDQKVLVRARIHLVRGKGKSAFLVLRQRMATVQAVLFADDVDVSKGMVKYASLLPRESIVDLEGVVHCPEKPVDSCTISACELKVTSLRCLSRAAALPFEVIDAARSDAEIAKANEAGEKMVSVNRDTRLDKRYIDLRTPANQAIFRVQSGVCQLFRGFLLGKGFTEIHSPKLIAGTSEGGAAVFHVDYMGQPGCLAQSPQLYKQMAICADLERVFEIGPVFRAENANTHRHLCEFMGLDLEMAIHEHYNEVLDLLGDLFVHMFDGLNTQHKAELEAIGRQYPFEPLVYPRQTVRIPFEEGIKMLHEAGRTDVDPLGDLNTEVERFLGKLVKEKYNTDFYILYRYPLNARPFYTMPAPDDGNYTNSFDIFIRGEEIISGAQRIHDPVLLEKRATECGIEVATIKDYIESFRYGAFPHGGCGVGLERVVMLFCGLGNIRLTSLFPRDPKRLTP